MSFAAYFYRAVDWSIATSDPYLLKQISAPTCTGCNELIATIDTVEAAGGYSVGGRVQINELSVAQNDGLYTADYVIEVTITQTAQTVVHSKGAVPSSYSAPYGGQPTPSYLYVGWGSNGWQAVGIAHE